MKKANQIDVVVVNELVPESQVEEVDTNLEIDNKILEMAGMEQGTLHPMTVLDDTFAVARQMKLELEIQCNGVQGTWFVLDGFCFEPIGKRSLPEALSEQLLKILMRKALISEQLKAKQEQEEDVHDGASE